MAPHEANPGGARVNTDAFAAYVAKHPEGAVVSARVVEAKPFGVFCELAPGVIGLLTVAEMKDLPRGRQADEHVSVGDSIEVAIAYINHQEAKIRLSQITNT